MKDDFDTVAEALREAYFAGVEDAAKVAESCAPVSTPGVNDTRIIHGAGIAMDIAKTIRALGRVTPTAMPRVK